MHRLILFLFFLALFSACDLLGPGSDCNQKYVFAIPCSFSPRQDSFHIGDTIWIEAQIPPLLYDSISEQEYSFGDFEHKINGALDIYDNPPQVFSGSDNFNIINSVGSAQRVVVGPGKEFSYTFKKTPGANDSLKIGFVPTRKGLYAAKFVRSADDYLTGAGIIKEDCMEDIKIWFRMNNRDSVNNFELLKGSDYLPTEAGFYLIGGYAFRVLE